MDDDAVVEWIGQAGSREYDPQGSVLALMRRRGHQAGPWRYRGIYGHWQAEGTSCALCQRGGAFGRRLGRPGWRTQYKMAVWGRALVEDCPGEQEKGAP